MTLSRNDINLDTKAAHLLPGIHNRFSDYYPDLNPNGDRGDMASLSAITVRHNTVVTQEDVDAGRNAPDELGLPVALFQHVPRRDEDGIETPLWHDTLAAIHEVIVTGTHQMLVTGVERGLLGLSASIDISVTAHGLREMWFALGATATRPRSLDNAFSTALEPLTVLNRYAMRVGMNHIFTDDELVHLRVVLGMCPLGLRHWRTSCSRIHPSEVTWR